MTGNDSRRPNVGRIYDALLGGKDNYADDRQAADQLLAVVQSYPNSHVAQQVMLAAAQTYEAKGNPRQATLEIAKQLQRRRVAPVSVVEDEQKRFRLNQTLE